MRAGETTPCAILSGPLTNLSDNLPYGNIAVSTNGFIHALSFQANDARVLTIDAPDANGNALPRRLVGLSPDAVALAVDANVTDYVVASENYQGDNCWFIVPTSAMNPTSSNCDANLSAIVALAVDTHGNLIAAGSRRTYRHRTHRRHLEPGHCGVRRRANDRRERDRDRAERIDRARRRADLGRPLRF